MSFHAETLKSYIYIYMCVCVCIYIYSQNYKKNQELQNNQAGKLTAPW